MAATKTAEVGTELRPHQERVLRRLRDQDTLIVAHGLGSGKTFTSIAAADDQGGQATVLAPAALLGNYRKEIARHAPDTEVDFALESLQRAGLRRELGRPSGRTLVVDEAHRLRDPSSVTRQTVERVADDFDKRLLLTATPVYNHPHDVAALVNIAAREAALPRGKGDFNQRYVAREQINPGFWAKLRGIRGGSRQRLKNKEELSAILGKWVDYHDNPPEGFPSTTEEHVRVPLSREQHDAYTGLMGQAPSWLRHKIRKGLPVTKAESKDLNAFASAVRQVSNTTLPFDERTEHSEQLQNSAKLLAAADRLKRKMDEDPDHKAVVYSNFIAAGIDPYEELLQEQDIPYGRFTGGMDRDARDALVRKYNEGELRALLISSAGGEGLDLKGTRQIQVLDPHWNEEKIRQVIGRGVRYGSHEHLPEEQRNVHIERYLGVLPERKGLGRFFRGKERGKGVDEYMTMLSQEKNFLNRQVRELMRAETEKRSGATFVGSTSIGATPGSSARKITQIAAECGLIKRSTPELLPGDIILREPKSVSARPAAVPVGAGLLARHIKKSSDPNTKGLLPGDLIFRRMGPRLPGPKSLLAKLKEEAYRLTAPMTLGSSGHVAVYLGDGRVVEANRGGVEVTPFKEHLRGHKEFAAFRGNDPRKAKAAVHNALSRVGEPYGFARMRNAGTATLLPGPLVDRLAQQVTCDGPICATLAGDAYEAAGDKLTRGNSALVNPAALATSDRLHRVGGTLSIDEALIGRHAGPLRNTLAATAAAVGLTGGVLAGRRALRGALRGAPRALGR